ncbi:MAG: cell division protein FtsW [Solirubrobacteraceae bacterium]|jgi:cell division protein FtsW|nr:cell division protein FtsW [Solirubrobacteraceae bacterium]
MAGRRAPKPQQPLEHRLLLTATFCLLAGGAVMVYSASSARTLLAGQGDGTAYLIKYLAYGAIGLVGMHILSRHGLELIRKITPTLLLVSFGMLIAVKIPGLGVEVNGAKRWLGAGPFQFQPSEIMKLALVLHTAAVIAQRPKITRELRLVIGPVLGPGICAIGLIFMEPDLGTALVVSFTLAAMLLVAGVPARQLALVVGIAALVILVFALMEPYRRARLTAFLNPWADAGDTGYQAAQGQIALGSGGLLGVGPGQSVQKIFYLPEAHTDFILAVIGEELGVAGISVLLFLYGMIAYAGLRTAKAAKGIYAKLLAAGLTSLILCQALLNIYAVLGLAPLTGVPLPFISSGSSSLVVLLCSMGLLLNIARGGSAHLRALDRKPRDDENRDRSRRDRGTRRPSSGSRRRAAG